MCFLFNYFLRTLVLCQSFLERGIESLRDLVSEECQKGQRGKVGGQVFGAVPVVVPQVAPREAQCPPVSVRYGKSASNSRYERETDA
jgi:hypothetical protein